MSATAVNEKNLIKTRQVCFFYIAFMPVTKILFMPAYLAGKVDERLYLPLLLSFILDGLILFLLTIVNEKSCGVTLYDAFSKKLGKWGAKAIYFLMAAYYFLKSLIPLFEHKLYIENTLYEMMPDRITFYLFFAVSTFLCLKGLKMVGRISDLAVLSTAIGLIIALSLSVGSADYANILPIMQKPSYNIVNATFSSSIWQLDSLLFLPMIGHVRPEKAQKRKILLSYLGTSAVTVFFFITYYGVYGAISPSQDYAITAISVFSVIVTNIGRFDYVAVFLLLFSQVFAVSVPLFFATKCLERVFDAKSSYVLAAVVNALAFIATIIFSQQVFAALNIAERYLCPIFIAAAVLFTILSLIGLKRSKNEEIA